MSHYTVLAIIRKGSRQNLESLLAPYDENERVEPYVCETKAELIKNLRERAAEIAANAKLAESLGNEAEYQVHPDSHYRYGYVLSEEGRKIAALADASDEEVFEQVKKEEGDRLNEDGDLISTYNPDSKWDWYDVGGRWYGSLSLKAGGRADEAKASEVDWDKMFSLDPEEEKRLSEFWDEYVLGKLPAEIARKSEKEKEEYLSDKHGFILDKPEYFLERYGTKAEYLRRQAIWTTYAVLDEKGWHAPGEMGWFGCSTETAETQRDWDENFRTRFIDTLDPEDTVVVVDCHI